MAIQTFEFYEGAALYRLVRKGGVKSILWQEPFFEIENRVLVYLKHTRAKRSPWGFTLTQEEQTTLTHASYSNPVVLGFICGTDGIAAVSIVELAEVMLESNRQAHISCYRDHNQFYEVNGPRGALPKKVAPSTWDRLVETFG